MSRTPLRALPSTLSSRATQSVPSSEKYDATIAAYLARRRSQTVLPFALLVCWLQATLWTIWLCGTTGTLGVFKAPFQPQTLVFGILSWISASIPGMIATKMNFSGAPRYLPLLRTLNDTCSPLTGIKTVAASPLGTIQTALKKKNIRLAGTLYAASAVAMTILHVIISYLSVDEASGDPKLRIFVKSRSVTTDNPYVYCSLESLRKHPYYINARFAFILATQLIAAASFLLRNVLMDRFSFRWESVSL